MNLANNLNVLKKNANQLYHQVKHQQPDEENYKVTQAKLLEMPNIEKMVNGRFTPIHSRFNPVNEATKWVEGIIEAKESNKVILFGFGFGYHFSELIKIFPRAKFIIYEPDLNILLYSLKYTDWSKLPWNRIELFSAGNSPDQIEVFANTLLKIVDHERSFFALPSYKKIFEQAYETLAISFRNRKEDYLTSLKTTAVFEKKWSLNALKNLKQVLDTPSIYDSKEQFKDRTVIMTASGPSLEDAISLIKEAQLKHQALIVAAGTSVNSLMHQGVTPDVFVSYDPFPGNYKALKVALDKGIPLIFGSTINHDVVENHIGKKAHFIVSQDTIYPFLDKSFDKGQIISDAPTIAAVTLQLLAKLGVKQVILAGQDLAYIGDKFYAAGTSILRSSLLEEKEKEDRFEVENNCGGISYTSKSFIKMKESLEMVTQIYKNIKIYNLSKFGAKITNTTYITNEAAKELLQENSVSELSFTFRENIKKGSDYFKTLAKLTKYHKEKTLHLEDLIKQMKVTYLEGKSPVSFFGAIDYCVNQMTARKDFNFLIRPFVRTRIHFAERAIQNIRDSNNPDSDIYHGKTEELYNYYIKEIGSLVIELKEAFQVYDSIQSNKKNLA